MSARARSSWNGCRESCRSFSKQAQLAELRSSHGLLEKQVAVLKQAIREMEATAARRATLGGMPTGDSADVSVNLQASARVGGARVRAAAAAGCVLSARLPRMRAVPQERNREIHGDG